jgi:hypothetical protein
MHYDNRFEIYKFTSTGEKGANNNEENVLIQARGVYVIIEVGNHPNISRIGMCPNFMSGLVRMDEWTSSSHAQLVIMAQLQNRKG